MESKDLSGKIYDWHLKKKATKMEGLVLLPLLGDLPDSLGSSDAHINLQTPPYEQRTRNCVFWIKCGETWKEAMSDGTKTVEQLPATVFGATYNLHFIPTKRKERTTAALILLREADADFLALQEVTPEVWEQFLADPWFYTNYAVSAISLRHHYGTILAVKRNLLGALESCSVYDLETQQGREVVAAWFFTPKHDAIIGVACVHLESVTCFGYDDELRSLQLRAMQGIADGRAFFVMGDMNFGDNEEAAPHTHAALRILEAHGWQDVDKGGASTSTPARGNDHSAGRVDRCLLFSPTTTVTVQRVTRTGASPICGGEVYVSDHVMVRFELHFEH